MDNLKMANEAKNLEERDQLDLAYMIDVIYDYRRMIVLVILAVVAIGTIYAVTTTPIYRADILVQVEENPSSARSILSDLSSMFDVKSQASTEIEILRSRLVAGQAVKNLHLDVDVTPVRFPIFGDWVAKFNKHPSNPGLFGFGGFAWGNESISISRFDVSRGFYGKQLVVTLENDGDYRISDKDEQLDYQGHIGRLLTGTTPLGQFSLLVDNVVGKPGVRFNLTHQSPISTIEALQANLQITEKGKDSDVIGVALEGESQEKVNTILNEIAKEYVNQNVQRKSEEADKSLKFLDKQLPDLKERLESAEKKFNDYRAKNSTIDLSGEAAALLQTSATLQSNLLQLTQQRDDLRTRFTDEHPAIRAIDAQIAQYQKAISENETKTRSLPPLEQQVVTLQRDVLVNTDLYTNLLNNYQQLQLIKAGKIGNVRLVDSASASDVPVKPRRGVIISVSGVVGLVLAVALAFVRRQVFGGLESANDIENHLNIPVYAVVPTSARQEAMAKNTQGRQSLEVLADVEPNDPAIESLRSFRTALQFALTEANSNILQITGPTPNVGKSFISLNLATVLANSGSKVLLIDADLRKGALQVPLGQQRKIGLSEIIVDGMRFNEVVRRNVIENLDFISTGVIVPNPAEVLSSRRFAEFIQDVSSKYDIVLIDSPPVIPVSEASTTAMLAGLTFLVARRGVTTIGELDETKKRLLQVGVAPKGVIFNYMVPRPGRYGYGGGRYRYSYYTYAAYANEKK
jgi:tyrosine-protein kinase Etk/Wzc